MSGVTHWLGFALLAAGSGVLALRWVHHHVAWPLTWPWRAGRVMVHLGLVDRKGEGPRLHRKHSRGDVWHVDWRMLVGWHTGRVEALRPALESVPAARGPLVAVALADRAQLVEERPA